MFCDFIILSPKNSPKKLDHFNKNQVTASTLIFWSVSNVKTDHFEGMLEKKKWSGFRAPKAPKIGHLHATVSIFKCSAMHYGAAVMGSWY